jgi:hypothetical protein
MHSEEIVVMNLWGVSWRKFFLPGWSRVRVWWLGCCCRAEVEGMCWPLWHSYVNILYWHAANLCRYLSRHYHLQQFLFHSLTSYTTGWRWWYVFVYDGIGGMCLCINLIHSAACFTLHEGHQILGPDVSDRVQRCSTFRETMAVHTCSVHTGTWSQIMNFHTLECSCCILIVALLDSMHQVHTLSTESSMSGKTQLWVHGLWKHVPCLQFILISKSTQFVNTVSRTPCSMFTVA